MQTFYVTNKEAINFFEPILKETKVVNCDCGKSLAYVDEKNNCQIIICDVCNFNAPHKERYF